MTPDDPVEDCAVAHRRMLMAALKGRYLSTACAHSIHSQCRLTCKFGSKGPCMCDCHEGEPTPEQLHEQGTCR